ncbi:hypothetical protein VTL71DRAFT_12485 [Oculimacula yallundae]|uniref:Rhodanese domain-containing protein n=1 Tax=Oculimacula yallundae TaxID=86028 RepID=A0ABR4CMV1_9HELO
MKERRLPTGTSDPIAFTCTCPAASEGDGLVLLFYRYFDATPSLPSSHHDLKDDPALLASFQIAITQKLNMGGNIRIAKEGFNITVGGTETAIKEYMQECISHWSFAGLDLSTQEKQEQFFKPTPGGCACAFGGSPASVRVTSEITPMGVTNYIPARWDQVKSLSPAEFHERCHSDPDTMLLDVRNHYESRIGYFVDPKTGEAALRPAIRRFSQWPQYVKKQINGAGGTKITGSKHIITYCTGGIRCEKGARFLQETLGTNDTDQVCTLEGGIAAYLTWMDEEIKSGRKTSEDSLFRGKNYVFDARGSTGLEASPETEPVSTCHDCQRPCDRLSKCRSKGCHLILVICDNCELNDPRCCPSCRDFDKQASSTDLGSGKTDRRPICACEIAREAELWGAQEEKTPKTQGWRKTKRKLQNGNSIHIQVKIVD